MHPQNEPSWQSNATRHRGPQRYCKSDNQECLRLSSAQNASTSVDQPKKKKKAAQVKIALFPHSPRNSTRKYCLQDVKMAETHCSTFTTYRPFPDPRHPAFRSSSTVVPPCPSVALSAVNCLLLRAL